MLAVAHLAVFVSNIYFMKSGGYFDAPLEANPVLQTWSLSVEEQFYLGLPLVLLLAHRYAWARLRLVIVAAALMSLAIAFVRVEFDPQKAFFATEVRIFELMIGAGLAIGVVPGTERHWLRSCVTVIGCAGDGCQHFRTHTAPPAFPGLAALPVCLGTAMIIWGGEAGRWTIVNRLLAWRGLVGIGLISYSVYLLHWPLIVFAKRILLTELTLSHKAALAVTAVAAGYCSWRWIETPFRRSRSHTNSARVLAVGIVLIGVLGIGSLVAKQFLHLSRPELLAAAERRRQIAAAEPCLLHQHKPTRRLACRQMRLASQGLAHRCVGRFIRRSLLFLVAPACSWCRPWARAVWAGQLPACRRLCDEGMARLSSVQCDGARPTSRLAARIRYPVGALAELRKAAFCLR